MHVITVVIVVPTYSKDSFFFVFFFFFFFRSEVLEMATEYAIWLGYRDKEHPLSFQWYSDFMAR